MPQTLTIDNFLGPFTATFTREPKGHYDFRLFTQAGYSIVRTNLQAGEAAEHIKAARDRGCKVITRGNKPHQAHTRGAS